MDGITFYKISPSLSSYTTEDTAQSSNVLNADASLANFEVIQLSEAGLARSKEHTEQHDQYPLSPLTEEQIKAQDEAVKQLRDQLIAAQLNRIPNLASPLFSDPVTAADAFDFSSWFVMTQEGTTSSTVRLTAALHEALSSPLNGVMTDTTLAFDIAAKKEKLTFINDHFIAEGYRSQASGVINRYIDKLVKRRDNLLLGQAEAELALSIDFADAKRTEAAQSDIETFKAGTHRTQREMVQTLSIADNARSFADMLDQFEMMVRNNGSSVVELQNISQIADHWEDFIQKYA
ncbi:hypothetical protein [Brenneria izbisi]|uniref:Uncharacterized protein n=1 Tax=Brenneria izbisi TaxID=2939450 RepID=A0AA41XV83_9GAMM|nr:hypothetical protein [Brenneria izbisi]MCV9877594.1 hypothetical protein [Brenneria izbisi]MCV9880841.1 hypothetical protein [Brenneria izbisi]